MSHTFDLCVVRLNPAYESTCRYAACTWCSSSGRAAYLRVRPQNRTTGSHTMSTEHDRVTLVSIPRESRIAEAYASTNLADAYSIELPSGASTNPELLARFIFSHQARWISGLIAVRDAIGGRFGLKTAKQLNSLGADSATGRLSIFKIYATSPTEIILG